MKLVAGILQLPFWQPASPVVRMKLVTRILQLPFWQPASPVVRMKLVTRILQLPFWQPASPVYWSKREARSERCSIFGGDDSPAEFEVALLRIMPGGFFVAELCGAGCCG